MRTGTLFPASLFAATLALSFSAPARADIVINVDKTTQQMTVAVDGAQRYVWPVSTGRAGYDTPNGTFKPNRMDADHLSQEWDNAPMPHTVFFDMHGHAIHGFFDVKHLGQPVSHGCVRLSPANAATLFGLIKAETMKETTVIVSGEAPAPVSPAVAQRRPPATANLAQPMQIAPRYSQQQPPYDPQQDQQALQQAQEPQQPPPQAVPYGQQSYVAQPRSIFGGPQQPAYAPPQPPPPGYGQVQQPYYGQVQQPYYGQQVYVPQYYVLRPSNSY
jgi:hypothetical protein